MAEEVTAAEEPAKKTTAKKTTAKKATAKKATAKKATAKKATAKKATAAKKTEPSRCVTVRTRFRDKETGIVHEAGDTINVTAAREAELRAARDKLGRPAHLLEGERR